MPKRSIRKINARNKSSSAKGRESTVSIFLSYARKDGGDLALRLRGDLENGGFNVWLDTTRIEGGGNWTHEIEQAIDQCEVMLALISPGSYNSHVCRCEQLRALRKGKRVIPLLAQANSDRPLHLEHLNYRDLSDRTLYSQTLPVILGDISSGPSQVLPERLRKTYVTVPSLPLNFIPRPQELARLRQAVMGDEDPKRRVGLTALSGMGGIGKSLLAQALCQDEVIQAAFPDGIIWVTIGRKPGDLVGQMREVGKALGDPVKHYDTSEGSANALRTVLQDKAVLVVLDDVWDPRHVEPFRVHASRCRLLFTARDTTVGLSLGARDVNLNVFGQSEAIELLRLWAGRDDAAFPNLAKRLGYLPLALKLAGARMREGMSANEWHERFHDISQLKLGRYARDPKENLEACFDISLDRFSNSDRSLYNSLGIFPYNISIPQGVIFRLWREVDPQMDNLGSDELLTELARQGLLELQSNNLVTWHDLLHDYQRSKLGQGLRRTHEIFLAAYNPGSKGWFSIEDDGYIHRHLAFHLDQAGQRDALLELLSDYRWLEAKLDSTDATALIADYSFVRGDAALDQVEDALVLSTHVLALDSTQLASQLIGRLQSMTASRIQELLRSARESKTGKWLSPLTPSLSQPGGSLLLTIPGHPGIKAIAILPGDRKAISGSTDGTFIEWDLETGREIRRIRADPNLFYIAIASDGRRAISAPFNHFGLERGEGELKVWNLESGECAREIAVADELVNDLAISLDGQRAAVSTHDFRLQIWSLGRGEVEHETRVGSNISHVAIRNDGRLVVCTSTRDLLLWRPDNKDQPQVLPTDSGSVALAVTPDGRYVVYAPISTDVLEVWELEKGEQHSTLVGHCGWIDQIVVSPQGRLVVASGWLGNTASIWQLDGGKLVHTLNTGRVSAMSITSNGIRLLTASDHSIKLWNITAEQHESKIAAHRLPVSALAVSEEGSHVLSSSADSTVRIWDGRTGNEQFKVSHEAAVNDIAVTPDGRKFVSASDDTTVKLWSLEDGAELATFIGHSGPVTAVVALPDGKRALSGSVDGTLKLWSLQTCSELHTISISEPSGLETRIRICRMLPSLDGQFVVFISFEDIPDLGKTRRSVKVLDLGDLPSIRELTGVSSYPAYGDALVLLNNGKSVLTPSREGPIEMWDVEKGRTLSSFGSDSDKISALAVTADFRKVVIGTRDGALEFWDLQRKTRLHAIAAHAAQINAITSFPNSEFVVSVSEDNSLKVWNVDSGAQAAGFYDDGALTSCSVLPDGSVIVATGTTGGVHFLTMKGVTEAV
jgi:WD40 repeat protein